MHMSHLHLRQVQVLRAAVLLRPKQSPRVCYALSKEMSNGFDKVMKHEDGESQEMQTAKGFRRSLEVACQPAKTRSPGKTAFHDPASGQQNETLLGFG